MEGLEKPCPGCGVMCEKTFGCGNITCPVPECYTHWCYFCGGKFEEGTIYKHISEEHGGFGADDYDDEDDLDDGHYYDD